MDTEIILLWNVDYRLRILYFESLSKLIVGLAYFAETYPVMRLHCHYILDESETTVIIYFIVWALNCEVC